ncbi:hypothetical protein RLO149_c033110 [Roseobacter litoralis Och 149]|uniref:Uncharacterized protein n=1 Tax=Roseobacter litoralis (strain ATCC 49566 / DSM 6996 / JCM 21268 / NBRC 15278 / OCh 149) TaxID=391595 RepID=F7ZL49_ROSLO|nr:hypothetical protein RLO149_c033110 [Roseobacter litoralis Och 149]
MASPLSAGCGHSLSDLGVQGDHSVRHFAPIDVDDVWQWRDSQGFVRCSINHRALRLPDPSEDFYVRGSHGIFLGRKSWQYLSRAAGARARAARFFVKWEWIQKRARSFAVGGSQRDQRQNAGANVGLISYICHKNRYLSNKMNDLEYRGVLSLCLKVTRINTHKPPPLRPAEHAWQ